ncbi:MAG: HAD family hydrolase [Anaerolineaceae bacterium]|nr:HAD family hydrolase [Anaerolineaceae bacterium]
MPLDWARIEAICFDVDGTLSDTDNHMVASIMKPMGALRGLIPHKSARYLARGLVMAFESPGNFIYYLADRLGIDHAVSSLADWLSRHALQRKPATFWLIPDVQDMLDQLEGRFPLSIVSARGRIGTETFLNQFQLHSRFRSIATSQTCRHTKPFPDPVIWAARQMGVAPANCLMVGDTVVDIKAGRAAGAQTAGVLCGFGTRRELERAGADVILNTTADLIREMDQANL